MIADAPTFARLTASPAFIVVANGGSMTLLTMLFDSLMDTNSRPTALLTNAFHFSMNAYAGPLTVLALKWIFTMFTLFTNIFRFCFCHYYLTIICISYHSNFSQLFSCNDECVYSIKYIWFMLLICKIYIFKFIPANSYILWKVVFSQNYFLLK